MEEYNGQQRCPNHGLFNISYSEDAIVVLNKIDYYASGVYVYVILGLSPFNIAANLLSAGILLTKDLRNPFNMILAILCLECTLPLIIRASSAYRELIAGIGVCNEQTQTYSKAMHDLIVFNTWAPFRAAYTWMTAFLTVLRYRALRSKGKWEASYLLASAGCMLSAVVSAAAGIPMFIMNVIILLPVDVGCNRANPPGSGPLVFRNAWSTKTYDNNCLIMYLDQWIAGIFHNTLPSIFLFIATIFLAFELGRVRKGHNAIASRSSKRTDDAAKAARMLSVVTILTLFSELPQGLISLANILLPIGFQRNYTDRLYAIFLVMQTITTSCNLLIYLAMSKAFRKAVLGIFCGWMHYKSSSPQASVISVSTVLKSK